MSQVGVLGGEKNKKSLLYPVLQRENRGFVDVELDCDFWFAGTDIAVGAGGVQDTWDQQLLPEVGTLVQEDLKERQRQT